jgi:hypothetical protein
MPRSLDLDRLKQFEARPASGQGVPTPLPRHESPPAIQTPIPATVEPARWPSREPVRDGQISIKAPVDVIERFRAFCRDDRRTYADMLTILMDAFPPPHR